MSDISNDIDRDTDERFYFRSYGNPKDFFYNGLYISDLDNDGIFHFLTCIPAETRDFRFICGEFKPTAEWINADDVIKDAKENGEYNDLPVDDITSPYFAKAVIEYYSPQECGVNWDTHMQRIEVEREMDDWMDYADFEEGGAAWW